MTPKLHFACGLAALILASGLAACDSEPDPELEALRAEGEDAAEAPASASGNAPEAQTAEAEKGGDCRLSETREIDFTPAEALDELSVQIDQEECQTAILEIEITDPDGETIYDHDVAFSAFDRTAAEKTGQSVQEVYTGRAMDLLNTPVQPVTELNPYEEEFMAGSPNLKLTQVEYEALRNSGLNYFCHWDGYENSVCIVYDEETGQAETFLTRTSGAEEEADETGETAQ